MCPPAATEKIKNLPTTVNEAGSSTDETLLRAHQFLTSIIKENKQSIGGSEDETGIAISDGHKPRFNSPVMDHCDAETLEQFILE